ASAANLDLAALGRHKAPAHLALGERPAGTIVENHLVGERRQDLFDGPRWLGFNGLLGVCRAEQQQVNNHPESASRHHETARDRGGDWAVADRPGWVAGAPT